MEYRHDVPQVIRDSSRFDPEFNVYVTPDETTWQYVNPEITGASVRDGLGELVLVARWVEQQFEHTPFAHCLTAEQANVLTERLNYA